MTFGVVLLSARGDLVLTDAHSVTQDQRALIADLAQTLQTTPGAFEMNTGQYSLMWVRQTPSAGVCTLLLDSGLVASAAMLSGLDSAQDEQAANFLEDLIDERAAEAHEEPAHLDLIPFVQEPPATVIVQWEREPDPVTVTEWRRIITGSPRPSSDSRFGPTKVRDWSPGSSDRHRQADAAVAVNDYRGPRAWRCDSLLSA